MARSIPAGRTRQLVDAATRVFIEQGFRRAQMADVAAALGVAKGTLYLYVESKEALLDAALRVHAGEDVATVFSALPRPTPRASDTLRYVSEHLEAEGALPRLEAALARSRVGDARGELEEIVRELYETLERNRTAVKLIDRCAADYPELAAVWYGAGRGALLSRLTEYVESRVRRRRFRSVPDAAVAARLIIETATTWAIHRYWDPAPQEIDARVAEDTVVQFLVAGLIEEAPR